MTQRKASIPQWDIARIAAESRLSISTVRAVLLSGAGSAASRKLVFDTAERLGLIVSSQTSAPKVRAT